MPAITSLRNGIPFGFEPETGKWFAEVNGKRTTSQDFDTLTNRVDSLLAAKKKENTVRAEVFEVTTMALGFETLSHPTPVKLRLVWNPKEGAPMIQKYQLLTEGQGWREFNKENLKVADIGNLPWPLKQHYAAKAINDLLDDRFQKAERAIAEAWIEKKTDATQVYRFQTHREVGLMKATDKEYQQAVRSSDKRNLFALHSDAVMEEQNKNKAAYQRDGWVVTSEGHWERSSGDLRVRLETTGYVASFLLEEKTSEGYVALFSARDFNEALQLAEITEGLKTENSLLTWVHSDSVLGKDHDVHWPRQAQIRGYAFISSEENHLGTPSGATSLYTLSRETDSELTKYTKNSAWAWEKKEGNQHGGSVQRFLRAGPEDQMLEPLRELRKGWMGLQQPEDTAHQIMKTLKPFTEEWLSTIYEANLNGDWEDPTPEALRARFERLQGQWAANAQRHDVVAKFDSSCNQAVEQALTPAQPATKPRGPKPGR